MIKIQPNHIKIEKYSILISFKWEIFKYFQKYFVY